MQIYCDSVVLMYYLEHTGTFHTRALNRLTTLAAAGDSLVVSELVRLECRVMPIRTGDAKTLAIYDSFFGRSDVLTASIDSLVFERATFIRARNNYKLGDSLHLAAAVESRCDRFLTNDARLAGFPDIAVEILP